MSEKVKGIYGSKTRADEVVEWLKSQGAKENSFNGSAENVIYFVDQEQVKTITENYACLFDIVELPRWRAEIGTKYHYVSDSGGAVESKEVYHIIDSNRYKIGNYFKTREEAEIYAEKFCKLLKKGCKDD